MAKEPDREKVVAFIVARLSSSRFPAKHLRKIGPKRIIDWSLEGLQRSQQIDQIVIATVAEPENEPIRQIAAEQGVDFFWYEGEVDDVTNRLRTAAEAYDADICLLVSGDCPLIYAPALDRMIVALKEHPEADFIKLLPDSEGNSPLLEGQGVFRRRAWQRADDLSDRPELKEHQFPIIWQRPDLFVAYDRLRLDSWCYGQRHRLSVDTWSDLEFMNKIHGMLVNQGSAFDFPSVVQLITVAPQLREINAHVHQRKVVEDVKRVVFIVDAGPPYGYGHLIRCIELAHQLVERKGYPVMFYVDDERTVNLLDEQGIPHLWGAYGRETRAPSPGEQKVFFDTSGYNFAVIDIHAGRSLKAGWKQADFSETEVLVLDSLAAWTAEADQVVIPGVTSPEKPEKCYAGTALPSLYYGKEYVMLRRDICAVKNNSRNKLWDLVVYLHDEKLRQDIKELVAAEDLRIRLIDSFDADFPSLLASSHAYLGNFGYSFYEAVYLDCFPFNWPLSEQHAADSRLFYQRLGLPDGVVTDLQELLEKRKRYRQQGNICDLAIEDGTPAIIEVMVEKKQLLKGKLDASTISHG